MPRLLAEEEVENLIERANDGDAEADAELQRRLEKELADIAGLSDGTEDGRT